MPENQAVLAGDAWTDEDVVRRVLDGDAVLFEVLMRRNNQRIYRAIRSVMRDDSEAEDVMQETYLRAFQHLRQFQGHARFSTWLTRIAVNEAIRRAGLRGRFVSLEVNDEALEDEAMDRLQQDAKTPEARAVQSEAGSMLEKAILALPAPYRVVVMLRDVEEMSTAETAEALSLSQANVKVRLHRAHELLRDEIAALAGASSPHAFLFHASRCDRVVESVLRTIARPASHDTSN